MKCVVDRYKWHRPFQMATTVLRNGNDRLRKGNLPRRSHAPQFIQIDEMIESCNVPMRRLEYKLTNNSHGNQLCIKI